MKQFKAHLHERRRRQKRGRKVAKAIKELCLPRLRGHHRNKYDILLIAVSPIWQMPLESMHTVSLKN